MANTVIQLKNSTVTGNVPSSLANGEISINSRDGKFFYSTPAGVVVTHYPYLGPAGLNQEVQFNDSGTLGSSSSLTFNKATGLLSATTLKSTQSSGDEGGQLDLATSATNTTLSGGSVSIDIYQNKLRIFESGGTNRGVYIDIANAASSGVGTNLLSSSTSTDSFARTQANAAFIQANAAFLQANTPDYVANSAAVYANGAFTRANNSLNSNTGGTVTANTTFSGNVTLTGNGTTLQVQSNVAFVSPNSQNTITATMLNGGTLSFSSNSGQLFSITDSLAQGSIFSVNDISGLPVIDVNANGWISLAQYGGNVHVYNTASATSNTTGALVVDGGVGVRGNLYTGNVTITGGSANGIIFSDGTTQFTSPAAISSYANSAFTRANNSINANTGGTITGNVTISANLTASNVATQTYIQFGDGTKQYTANSGSGGGSTSNSFATISNTATALVANTSNTRLTIVGESGIAIAMNTSINQITVAGTPGAQGLTVDYGYVTDPTYYGFDYGYLS
jgi:hypothetical protein